MSAAATVTGSLENGTAFSSSIKKGSSAGLEFTRPQEAPVFYPTAEEFDDPLAYLSKIRPIAEKAGICKICPPKDWQPPFAVDVDNFRFTPRIQRLNELEAKTRIKLNFLDQIAKFWELQGSSLKIPMIEKKALDLYSLHKLVQNEGGFEKLNTDKKWNRVSSRIGYNAAKSYGSLLRAHYEKILYPFDVFQKSKSNFKVTQENDVSSKEEFKANSSKNGKNSMGKSGNGTVSIDQNGMSKPRKGGGATSGELRRLLFYGAGPKMESHNRQMEHLSEAFGGTLPPLQNYQDPLAKYVCRICRKGDGDDWMLLCDGCDDSYHTYCLSPPLEEVPKGEWRCPHCVAKEVCKPSEAFGFEQAQREYTLQQFGEMADKFKSEYFNMPVHKISTEVVEKEFWRIVSSIDEDVTVEYGADLHTMDHGSGFPTEKSNSVVPEDEKYIHSKWNLNNIPVLPNSVLGHINADISGMKVPWMYVGMCFATFCWHNEDHWSYSINYLHWGEPKTWYGVPGSEADGFEEAMKSAAPELFQSQPDLLHQLVTIMNPNILMDMGVPVFRTDQKAGEFVITFPRAYHAGFNQGYNFAEAVNFAPADWLAMGRDCVSHYSSLHRYCVFSHDELVCKMGAEPQNLDLVIAVATYRDLVTMFEAEKALRAEILEWGTKDAVRASFEALPDDERICDFCKTTCYLSAITCSCTDKLVCLRHFQQLCGCPPSAHVMKFRYTLDELPGLLTNLQSRIKGYEAWLADVTSTVDGNASTESRNLGSLQVLVEEAEVRNYPKSSLWHTANDILEDARKLSKVAKSVLVGQIRTRNRENKIKFALLDIESLLEKVETLPVDLDETPKLKELMDNIRVFQFEAARLLNLNKPCIDEIRSCLTQGQTFEVELPEVKDLEMALSQCKWLDTVEAADDMRGLWTLEYLEKVIESGLQLHKDPLTHERIVKLQKMRLKLLDWEERAKLFLSRSSSNLTIADLDALLKDGRNMDIALPSLPSIRDISAKVHNWVNEVRAFENRKEFPFLETLETIVTSAEALPVYLKQQKILSNQVQNARTWISKCSKAFLKKKSNWSLIEVMLPLTVYVKDKKQCGNTIFAAKDTALKLSKLLGVNQSGLQNSKVLHEAFNKARIQEKQLVESLRAKNRDLVRQDTNTFKCICNIDSKDFGIRCEICFDWFHATCVPLPKIFDLGDEDGITSLAMVCEQISAGVIQYICPVCCRSRRPKLETIVDLLEALHELPVKLYEGEILTLLVNRAMKWMDDARQLMSQEDMLKAYDELHVCQHSPDSAEGSKFLELSSTTIAALENLLIEGGLMEITFEETAKLWKVYSAYNQDFYAKKDLRLIRSQILNAVAGKRNHNAARKSIARNPAGPHITSGTPEKRKNVATVNSSPKKLKVQEYDEDCAAIECRQPSGKEVNWVQCESRCLKWFHLICVGLKKGEVKKLKSYQCDRCSKA